MIKFLVTNRETNREIFGMVITKENVNLLQNNKPIHINAEQLNLPYFKFNEILIMYYETNEAAEKDLREKGYITEDTKIVELKPTIKN